MLRRRVVALVAVCLTVGALSAALAPAANAQGNGVNWPSVASTVPATATPNITNGTVYAITQVGSRIVVGGSFTGVQDHGSTTTVTRNRLLAFDATTGAVSTTFAPTLDGTVQALTPGPTADTVYVGGMFTNVNGVRSKGITLISTMTGAIVAGFKPPALDGIVYSVARSGSHLLLAGTFTKAGTVAHAGLMSVNPTTGALDPFMNVQLAGHHNFNGTSGANGGVGPRSMALNPAGTRAVVIGNFKTASGLTRDQAVLIDLDTASAAVDPNWATQQFTAACFSGAFDTYVTDVQYSADGSYFAITATGGSGTNVDGSNSLCDTASRWESASSGQSVTPTWVDYTGQDSLWSVAITGSAIYVGGHERWLNNSNGFDFAGAGAVPRPGIAALDPASGVPMAWNPGRSPRGAGAYALYASPTGGLYVGSDTDWIGNRKYLHQKIAFFPLAGGKAPASTATKQLPANFYEAGQLPSASNTNVLYRVNAGGPTVGAIDNGPDWLSDGSDTDPGAQFRSTGSNAAGWNCCAALSPSVPASTPGAIFDSERWDPGTKLDGGEMQWTFPVAAGTHVRVRLFFANRYSGTGAAGQRVFDVGVDGTTLAANYDIVTAAPGDQTATMLSSDVISPGSVTVDLTHEVENPLINGIELINLDAPVGAATVGDLAYRAMNGSSIGALTAVPNTGIDWNTTRGAFMVGNTIFYGATDGNFYSATFNGTTVGTPTLVDPYNDPVWSSIATGSGQTYQGTKSGYYSEISSVTGAFYSNGRLYYSLLGQAGLFSRWFSPDSGIIGSQEFTVGGANFSNIAGMVLSGSTLYYSNRSDGTLHTIGFVNGTPDASTDAVVSGPSLDGNDWRSRGMFLFGAPTFPNQAPTASATSSCSGLSCSFNATASSDPDGSVVSYDWNFGDATPHGTAVTTSHSYARAGTYNVSLVVTDDRGAQSTPWSGTVNAVASTKSVAFVGKAGFNGSSASPSVVVPAGVNAGDTELLFVSAATAGVIPTAPAGWTPVARRTNAPLETAVFSRVGTAADSGSTVTVPLTAATKVDVGLVVYSGVDSAALTGASATATAADTNSTTHVAPSVAVSAGGSWVVSYWADRTSNTTTWVLPAGVTTRNSALGIGGGRVDSALADSGQALASGAYGPLTASSTQLSGKGDMVSVVLSPAP